MSPLEVDRQEYDSLLNKLVTLEAELKHTKKLMEALPRFTWWKRLWRAAVFAALLLAFGVGTWGTGDGQAASTANDYVSVPHIGQLGYIQGVLEAFDLIRAFKGEKIIDLDKFVRCANGMTTFQIHAIVGKYLKDNPRQWHNMPMAANVYFSVIVGCGK